MDKWWQNNESSLYVGKLKLSETSASPIDVLIYQCHTTTSLHTIWLISYTTEVPAQATSHVNMITPHNLYTRCDITANTKVKVKAMCVILHRQCYTAVSVPVLCQE